ncbi:uncharacterized protein LOC126576786 [Anopheles aquasalis]|uniref:uncharacterized protein LOC126576786 n=1 Tax=Anopheles aquasalis TaxID=42839 RepID=UPI00215B41C6|nr:uncharacterized protein LOC126576786 [Anopheles aquasalis]
MVIHKIYVPPSVVKLPPRVDPNHLPPATAYQPPAGADFPLIAEDAGAGSSTLPPFAEPLPPFAEDPVVELGPGQIVGRKKVLPNGTEYYSYQGVPYAHPPVGELRFKPPVPLEKFTEEPLQCGEERGICLATFYLPPSAPGTEDCLYLNVYTPSAPGNRGAPLKPVMVWIHGGGFYTGSGNTDFYGPEPLLQHDVILVTFNYRLGPLGFLALPAVGVYGNQGLKDQQLALKWVHDNIAQFGGDPSNVTLFGESAGGASVHLHYLTEGSRKYFHKAIAQSGTMLCPWALQYQPEHKARRLAALLGYTGEDDAGVLETLQNASVEDLVANSTRAFDEAETTTYLLSPFIPVIEDAASEDPIIPHRSEELLKQANTVTIPLISGVTSAEGIAFHATISPKLAEIAANLSMVMPLDLAVPHDQSSDVHEEVRQFYFQDQAIDETNISKLLELLGDVTFNFPVYAAAVLQSRYQPGAPQYFYRFGYETELNQGRVHVNVPDGLPGAAHADELAYLFSGSAFKVQLEPDSASAQARDLVSRLWTNFAKFGNPTPDEQVGTLGFQWAPVVPTAEEPFQLHALELTNDAVTMIENPFAERMQFWKSLYERYNPTLRSVSQSVGWCVGEEGCPLVPRFFYVSVPVLDLAKMVMRNIRHIDPAIQLAAQQGCAASRVMVKVAQGFIYGTKDRLPNGQPYYCFKGVPYAQPPIGRLRFASPVPIEKYSATYLDCSRERSACFGRDVITREITGSEDGLFLNVYTPRIGKEVDGGNPLPVMVFFHGGGMTGGNADSSLYLPDYLVQEGVIVVTVNYRLGVLGFLCLPQAGIEGNAGLKDQRMALQWVQQNIPVFGGNRENVTLFGASSGGTNVLFLHFADQSSNKKLFQKTIAQSATIFSDLVYQTEPEERARSLARIFGYEGTSDEGALSTLRDVPARRLYEAQFLVLSARQREYESIFQFPFTAVIERPESVDAVLRKTPVEYLRERDFFTMPVLCGYNDRDGMLELIDMMKHLAVYNERPEKLICASFEVDYFSPEARALGEELRRHYLGEERIARGNISQLVDLLTDRFLVGFYLFCQLWHQHQTKAPVYSYRFAYDGSLNKGKELLKFRELAGACHIDEVYYLFSSALLRTEIAPGDPAYQMRRTMVQMWTNFAKHSDPTPPHDERLAVRWEPMRAMPDGEGRTNYTLLSIGNDELKMDTIPELGRMQKYLELLRRCNGAIDQFPIPKAPEKRREQTGA